MWPSWLVEVSTMGVLFILSAFFSGSETALMAVNRIRLRHQSKTDPRAQLARTVLRQPDRLIGTLLFCNNLVNVALSAIGTALAIRLWGEQGVAYATVVITVCLLVFSEITPKTIAAYYAYPFSLVVAPWIHRCIRVLFPLVRVLTWASDALIRACGLEPAVKRDRLTEEEIAFVIQSGGDEGALDLEKKEMLLGVLMMERTTVGDIMVPLHEVISIPVDVGYEELFSVIETHKHARYPVYRGAPTEIIGFIHALDFLLIRDPAEFNVRSILRQPHFVPEVRTVRQQLMMFQEERAHMSFVVDEYGNILGIVTLEDVLEEIVGEIQDEHDPAVRLLKRLPGGVYQVEGKVSLRDLNRWLQLDLPADKVRTVGGLILQALGRIPEPGEEIRFGRYRFRVEELKGKTIKKVRFWVDR